MKIDAFQEEIKKISELMNKTDCPFTGTKTVIQKSLQNLNEGRFEDAITTLREAQTRAIQEEMIYKKVRKIQTSKKDTSKDISGTISSNTITVKGKKSKTVRGIQQNVEPSLQTSGSSTSLIFNPD